jgi:hypothetical protein
MRRILAVSLIACAVASSVAASPAAATAPAAIATATPTTITFEPGYYVAHVGDLVSAWTDTRSYQPLQATTASALEGQPFAGATWALVLSGPLQDWWVEVEGNVAVASEPPIVSLRFRVGRYTGHRFDSDFSAITRTKTSVVGIPRTATGTEKRKINGANYIFVTSGTWAGYWMRYYQDTAMRINAPLPACDRADTLTRYRAYRSYPRTLLDWQYRLPRSYRPADLQPVSRWGIPYSTAYGGVPYARRVVRDDYLALYRAAASAGVRVRINSGFRSYALQAAWWRSSGDPYLTARPGHSEHQLGTALDLYATSYSWLKAKSWKFGFVLSFPSGKRAKTCMQYEYWHFRYVGRSVAYQIHASSLTPREWIWFARH